MFTKKFNLATKVLLSLSEQNTTTIASLSRLTGGTTNFLEQIVREMRVLGLVRSVRGPGGGYKLTKPRQNYKFIEVYIATTPKVVPTRIAEKLSELPLEDFVC